MHTYTQEIPMRLHIRAQVTDLCEQCTENFVTVDRLRSVAAAMGMSYDVELQPCALCSDRYKKCMYVYRRQILCACIMSGVVKLL